MYNRLLFILTCSISIIIFITLLKFQKQDEDKMQKKWCLFHATDFQTLMYPCFTFCRILGLFPYKINNSIFKPSKPHYILSSAITCVVCILNMMITKSMISTKINFEAVMTVILSCCFILICSFAIITLVLSNPRMRLLQTIMEISSKLSPESYQKLSKLIHTKDIFGSIYIIGLASSYLYKKRLNIFFAIFSIYTGQLTFQMDMLYVNCVCVLKACFKEINNNLRHIQKFIVNSEQHILISYYERRNSFLIIKLKALKKQHMMISNTVQILNTIFSGQLLITIVITLIEMSLDIYFYAIEWHDGLVINLNGQFSNLFLLGMIYFISKTALIFWACETGKNQAQEMRTTIHDVLNSTRDEIIKDELQLFSLQLLHCRNTFSAKGLNVDATFLTTMVGTITTYMLITLQFLIMSHSCDTTSATANII
ncbi:Putative gustatory receptor 28b [Trachymyrmex zeteki]|uniref:Gustatory receptor n=1 Tax=Mycetomoellerius zeteki TaxID=64791 RepID=A0A151XHS2_9HYME|nr:Putative gustatory receptor 28b [Trachymyrmex zeteki]